MHHSSLSKFALILSSALYLATTPAIHAQETRVPKALEDIPAEDVAREKDWFVKVGAGVTMKSGNTESDSYNARLETEKIDGDTIIRLLADGNYAESKIKDDDGSTHTSRTDGNAKINLNIKERFPGYYLFVDGLAFHDGPADIRFRGVASTGIGTFLADSETFKFSIDAGIAYVEERTKIENDDYWAFRFGNRLDYTFTETINFWQTTEYIVETGSCSNYLISSEFGVASALTKLISLNIIFKVDYDSEPPQGTDKTDRMLGAQIALTL